MSWKVTPLYFYRSNDIYFAWKGPIKVQIFQDFWVLGSKFTKFLSFLKQQISFSSNFASLLSVMRHNSSLLVSWNCIYFQQKEPIKVQNWWNFMWAVGSLKFCTFMGSFCPNLIKFQLKNTEELSFITMKSDKKFKEKLTCVFKYHMRNLVNFHQTTQKCENFTSVGSFCPKNIRSELKKMERSYLSWDWTVMKNVVSKMTWGIVWTFIRALKSL